MGNLGKRNREVYKREQNRARTGGGGRLKVIVMQIKLVVVVEWFKASETMVNR